MRGHWRYAVVMLAAAAVIVVVFAMSTAFRARFNEPRFHTIRIGMAADDVIRVLGRPDSDEVSRVTAIRTLLYSEPWQIAPSHFYIISIQDGVVIETAKRSAF